MGVCKINRYDGGQRLADQCVSLPAPDFFKHLIDVHNGALMINDNYRNSGLSLEGVDGKHTLSSIESGVSQLKQLKEELRQSRAEHEKCDF
jgi:hypothetical protein